MAFSGGRAGSSLSLLLGRRWRQRALSAGVGLFCVTTVALFVRWLPRPYADRLGDIQAYCNALRVLQRACGLHASVLPERFSPAWMYALHIIEVLICKEAVPP